jgi:nucleoside triphosphatase
MKPRCEKCGAALPDLAPAWICSYECTFCETCAGEMSRRCPNCGGELVSRPRRGEVPAAREAPGPAAPHRVVVVALVRNRGGDYLLCRMPPDRGVFPGQWGLPGGGLEPGETLEEGLRREVREELGLEIAELEPLFFKQRRAEKLFADGTRRALDMVFLVFECGALPGTVRLNPEFEAAEWVAPARLREYDLNVETRDTLARLGL